MDHGNLSNASIADFNGGMIEIILKQGPASRNFEADLFHRHKFFALHCPESARAFYFRGVSATHNPEKNLFSFAFTETSEKGYFKSPLRGSYGGLGVHAVPHIQEMALFLDQVLAQMQTEGARGLDIACAPHCYDPTSLSLSYNLFLQNGFSIFRNELNYAIPVSKEEFESRLDRGNRARLKKGLEHHLKTRLAVPSEYRSAYEVICANRARRGFPITMSWPQLEEMFAAFPEDSKVFLTTCEDRTVASAICFRINSQILYVFYWGEADGLSEISPITSLAKDIYTYAQSESYRLLDLGTSTIDGAPNLGLIHYKLNLGAEVSNKFFFRKVFNEKP